MRSEPNQNVVQWVAGQTIENLYTTYLTQAEILYGIAVLPEGRRRNFLTDAALAMFREDFKGRILPFESQAAENYSKIVASRRNTGAPIEAFDAMIGAIAMVFAAIVATRDSEGFANIGVSIINPWLRAQEH